jgi:hypothetical protein
VLLLIRLPLLVVVLCVGVARSSSGDDVVLLVAVLRLRRIEKSHGVASVPDLEFWLDVACLHSAL